MSSLDGAIQACEQAAIRVQLSLFVPSSVGAQLEPFRWVLDPVQAKLIPAHVTLCREDEFAGLSLEALQARLDAAEAAVIELRFGPAEVFAGHGVLLPCVAGSQAFQDLRRRVLGSEAVREHAPHLTLAHPRNPRAVGNTAAALAELPADLNIEFSVVSRIEQANGSKWRILQRYPLRKRER